MLHYLECYTIYLNTKYLLFDYIIIQGVFARLNVNEHLFNYFLFQHIIIIHICYILLIILI